MLKMLKSVLAAYGEEIPRTHDLMNLNYLCSKLDKSYNSLANCCMRLSAYGVSTRSPMGICLSQTDIIVAIGDMEIIENFISKKGIWE